MASFDPKTLLIVMALRDESQGLFEASGIQPYYTGIGQVRAAFGLTKAIHEQKPVGILNLGTAGSFDLPQGQIVECSAFIQRQSQILAPKSKTLLASGSLSDFPKVICGSADFIQHEFTGGARFDIMDMEAYALAYVAAQMKLPFYSIKVISDHSTENVVSDWKKNLAISAENLFNAYQGLHT
ncbi:MAG: hypothetical protein A2622_12875 [Bdellovibrionales bacterium RIFCSPHIGHO2_01_FULL_40_29]|nr:MAG: hypothetical protein A2622_12875 [Bdellovibrionales bacterium RIFCSPHIGHO2_01_FULL_40_29]OFZ33412.1 MAG: hypothetical protein A3D17_14010 [Bdellovibrionales bacterium RIFCSPHIGHO2_02_FULL_40_15]